MTYSLASRETWDVHMLFLHYVSVFSTLLLVAVLFLWPLWMPKKAFDRVNHIKLLNRMCDIGVPRHIIKLIMNWYSKVMMIVRWDNCYSSPCSVKSRVRQGSVLSPVLFNVYFSVIVDSLGKAELGCELYGKYIGCIVYADDVILLSSSVVKLQQMLDICYGTGLDLDVVFNFNHQLAYFADQ